MTPTYRQIHPWRRTHLINTVGMAEFQHKQRGHRGGKAIYTMPWQRKWIHHGNDPHTSRVDTRNTPLHRLFTRRKLIHTTANTSNGRGGTLVVKSVTVTTPEFRRGSHRTGKKICPYPLCPSYRHFAQNISVLIIGILVWLIVWMVLGDTAAPGGQLFMLASLTIAANIGGWLMVKLTTLPALIGMLFTGVLLKNIGFVNFNTEYLHVCSYIRKIALTIILTRAGLDLDPMAMKKCFFSVIKLAVVPWTFEFVLCAVMSNLLLGLPWDWAFLLGSVVAAVSPAVVVPCLFRLRSKGYGVSKGIPTLVLAVSGVDDAISVAIFGILASIMFSSSSVTMNIIQGPLSVILGIAFGVLCGYLIKFIPERNDAFLVPLRVLLLLTGGIASIFGSEEIGWGGAGPMAVIAFSYVACKNWVEQGWELDDNPVATANEIFWMFFEPMLFSITGAQVVIADLPPNLVLVSVGILMTCVILRAMVTSASAVCSNLNMKEKIFVGFSWMAKATVQAALATVPLDYIRKLAGNNEPSSELLYYADTIITICILSIILTAPLGAIIITITGPRLLSKTSKPPVLEGKNLIVFKTNLTTKVKSTLIT